MKKLLRYISIGIITIANVLALSCAPATAQSPVSPPSPAQMPSSGATIPASNLPPPASQDPAWQKVIEAARKEGKLNLYSFSMIGDVGLQVSRAFENRYGIKVDIITGRGAEFIERIKTEERLGQVTADIMDASSTHTFNLKAAGATVSTLDIPVLREKNVWRIDPLAADSEGHLLVQRSHNISTWINTNLIKPGQEPKSFRDLAKPEWKGKILLPDPSVSTSSLIVFLPLVDRGYLDMEFVRSLKDQDLKFVTGTPDIVRALSRGEMPLGLGASDTDAAPFLAEGAPFKAIALEEGTVANVNPGVVVKGAPHPNTAKLFTNWILGVEGQTVYTRALGLASIRKDVSDFRHPNSVVNPKRLIIVTDEDIQRQAKAFRDKVLVDMWRR